MALEPRTLLTFDDAIEQLLWYGGREATEGFNEMFDMLDEGAKRQCALHVWSIERSMQPYTPSTLQFNVGVLVGFNSCCPRINHHRSARCLASGSP